MWKQEYTEVLAAHSTISNVDHWKKYRQFVLITNYKLRVHPVPSEKGVLY